jgi:hypothetical protein
MDATASKNIIVGPSLTGLAPCSNGPITIHGGRWPLLPIS